MPIQYTDTQPEKLKCPVCGTSMEVRLAKGRNSGKTFIMTVCPVDGRHMRAFINDAVYVRRVIERLEAGLKTKGTES